MFQILSGQGIGEGVADALADAFELGVDGLTLHTQQDEALELMADLAGCRPRA